MNLVYDEDSGKWKKRTGLFLMLEVPTKKAYDTICDATDLQRELHELGAYNFRGDARDPVVWMKAVNRLIEQYATLESED